MQVYSHPIFATQGSDFPGMENPQRIKNVWPLINESERVYSREYDSDPHTLSQIEEVHRYLEELKYRGPGYIAIDDEEETFIDRLSYRTAIAAVVTSIYAAEAEGFALIRPPGHHAHKDYTHGFCLLNNMALTAKHLLKNGERVLILDLDIHHGCGTEDILQKENDVKMISLYQRETKRDWPASDHFIYAQNCTHIPLIGEINDTKYMHVFDEQVLPQIKSFEGSIIGISLGLDTFENEVFGWHLTEKTLKHIRQRLKGQRLFALLEGGYKPRTIQKGLEAFLQDP